MPISCYVRDCKVLLVMNHGCPNFNLCLDLLRFYDIDYSGLLMIPCELFVEGH